MTAGVDYDATIQTTMTDTTLTFGNNAAVGALWKFDFNRAADHSVAGGDAVTPGTPCAGPFTADMTGGPSCWISVPTTQLFDQANTGSIFGWKTPESTVYHQFLVSEPTTGVPGEPSDGGTGQVFMDGVLVRDNIFQVRTPTADSPGQVYRVTIYRYGQSSASWSFVYEGSSAFKLSTLDGKITGTTAHPWSTVTTGGIHAVSFDTTNNGNGILDIGIFSSSRVGLAGMTISRMPTATLTVTAPGSPTGTYTATGLTPGSYATVYADVMTASPPSSIPDGLPDASAILRARQASSTAQPAATFQVFDSDADGTVTFSWSTSPPLTGTAVHVFEFDGLYGTTMSPLLASGVEVADPLAINQLQLGGVVEQAIDYWSATGLTADQLARLEQVEFRVEDLEYRGWDGNALGLSYNGTGLVLIDNDAAGMGWSVETLPGLNLGSGTGQFDLLTAVMHEMGHVLGYGDVYAPGYDGLMSGRITGGTTRLPAGVDLVSRRDTLLASPIRLDSIRGIGTLDVGADRLNLLESEPASEEDEENVVLATHAKLIAQIAFPDRLETETDALVDLLKDRDRLGKDADDVFAGLDEDEENWMFD
jgi:hypothetical protein